MANENELQFLDSDLTFKELEESLSKQLEDSFADLEGLEKDRAVISNPEALGKVMMDEIWTQFGNQIGLDITNETTIQKYDRLHPEDYTETGAAVMQDERFKNARKSAKSQQLAGTLKDEYTGKILSPGESMNVDHVVSRKELYENQRRKQANMSVADVANKQENLVPTNEALNKSKGAKSIQQYVDTREIREEKLHQQNVKMNQKVDQSNEADADKRLQKEKNDKRLNDKLAADDDRMLQADRNARKAINKDVLKEATKEAGKKSGKDALKAMTVTALSSLLKEIMNGLVRFFKEKSKSFEKFLGISIDA